MGWLSILPEHLSFFELWIARLFVRRGELLLQSRLTQPVPSSSSVSSLSGLGFCSSAMISSFTAGVPSLTMYPFLADVPEDANARALRRGLSASLDLPVTR